MTDKLDALIDDAIGDDVAQPDPAAPVEYMREGFAWAQDCFWVYENLGGRMTRDKAGTAARFALWKFAKAEMDKFMGQLLPKAMTLLEKSREKAADTESVVDDERKAIRELRKLLKRAVAEATGS